MKEENLSFLYADIGVEEKVGVKGIGEKLGPTGRAKRKLVNLNF